MIDPVLLASEFEKNNIKSYFSFITVIWQFVVLAMLRVLSLCVAAGHKTPDVVKIAVCLKSQFFSSLVADCKIFIASNFFLYFVL